MKRFFYCCALGALMSGCALGVNGGNADTPAKQSPGQAENVPSVPHDYPRGRLPEDTAPERIRQGYSIVKTADDFDSETFTALGGQVEYTFTLHNGYTYYLVKTETDAAAFRAQLADCSGVVYAQADHTVPPPQTVDAVPHGIRPTATQDGDLKDDPTADMLDWGLTVTHALEAFKEYDGKEAKHPTLAAIIDTGTNMLHEDFFDEKGESIILFSKASIKMGDTAPLKNITVIEPGENWDDVGHGTHCSGTIAAVGNNGKGICGVAHANTKLIAYRGLGFGGDSVAIYSCLADLALIFKELRKEPAARDLAVFAGLPQRIRQYPKVMQKTLPVNMSLGGYDLNVFELEMINFALAADVLPIIAMGNEGKATSAFPAAFQGVLSVGATNMYDKRAEFSDAGSWMSVCAPGKSIPSCSNGGTLWHSWYSPDVKRGYRWLSGTSMAAPFVTGTAAYLLSIRPELTPYQLKTVLEKTADKIDRDDKEYGQYDANGFSKWYGHGRVNVLKAARMVASGAGLPQPGAVYTEKALKLTVKDRTFGRNELLPNIKVWLYEKQSNLCAAVGQTTKNGYIEFHGLKTGVEYEIGVNYKNAYQSWTYTPRTDRDVEHTFEFTRNSMAISTTRNFEYNAGTDPTDTVLTVERIDGTALRPTSITKLDKTVFDSCILEVRSGEKYLITVTGAVKGGSYRGGNYIIKIGDGALNPAGAYQRDGTRQPAQPDSHESDATLSEAIAKGNYWNKDFAGNLLPNDTDCYYVVIP